MLEATKYNYFCTMTCTIFFVPSVNPDLPSVAEITPTRWNVDQCCGAGTGAASLWLEPETEPL